MLPLLLYDGVGDVTEVAAGDGECLCVGDDAAFIVVAHGPYVVEGVGLGDLRCVEQAGQDHVAVPCPRSELLAVGGVDRTSGTLVGRAFGNSQY